MKKIIIGMMAVLALTSCTNYGKKIKIDGTKGEVYYKGDGVTEADATKLGNYLKEEQYFDNTDTKTVQLLKSETGGYNVRFVVDEKKLKETPNAEDIFVGIGALLSRNVFGDQPVNVHLTDSHLKDLKVLAYDKKKAEELLNAGTTEPQTDTTTLQPEMTAPQADTAAPQE